MGTAVVVIDYQNIHLTAHGQFCAYGAAVHECLIHPLHFANAVVAARRNKCRLAGYEDGGLDLGAVLVYRGLPDSRKQPDQNRRSQMQRTEWTRDPRVKVFYRPLRYQTDFSGNWTAQEKGVDVMVALSLVALAESGQHELVILAAHDTDLEPAIEFAQTAEPVQAGRVSIETAGWYGCKRLKGGAFHTVLGQQIRERVIDHKDYR